MKEKSDSELRDEYKLMTGKSVGNIKRETLLTRIATLELQKVIDINGSNSSEAILSAGFPAFKIASENYTAKVIAGDKDAVNSFESQMSALKAKFPDRFPDAKLVRNTLADVLGQVASPPVVIINAIGGCSEEQVMETIKDNIAKGMTANFKDNCWSFERKGRMDSGTMSQPIYNIKKCADAVCVDAIPAARIGLTKSLLF